MTWLLFTLQTMFSTVVLVMSLLITMVSMVVWLRNMRHPPADSHFSHISSSTTESGNISQSCMGGLADDGDIQEDHLSQSSSSQRQQSPCQHQLPCQQQKNYQACGASHQCASKFLISGYFVHQVHSMPLGNQGNLNQHIIASQNTHWQFFLKISIFLNSFFCCQNNFT